ncbi:MAG: alpha/beta fold hydrolase [Actinobacteria bacterium]|nr:alpha/beta fold hydrolase [Actinomycetota bacterium]MDI6830738.1 prolyl oligopeptidase family serine peptidase [Actinomycetota bacterium]
MRERELVLEVEGVTLRGTVLVPEGGGWPLVVLCHGIPSGEPVSGDPGYPALAARFASEGCAAAYFNFRGTGISGGDFSLGGWALDLEALLDEAGEARGPFRGCDPERMALVGFSGGGAVSIICAARRGGLAGVAAISSPADFSRLLPREGMAAFIARAREIGIIRDPAFPASEEAYYREMLAYSPAAVIGEVSPTPLLIVHGDADDMVPVEEAYRLYEAAREPKELFIVEGGGHKLRLHAAAMDRAVSWVLDRLQG